MITRFEAKIIFLVITEMKVMKETDKIESTTIALVTL